MSSSFKNTCILYFTTQLESEKRFSSHERKHKVVQKILFEKTLSEIQQSRLAYVISDGKTYGHSFEERIIGAISAIFKLGYQNLIVVGDDTPNLSATNLLEAEKKLENQTLTIGPSADGGSYLISLTKENFQQGALENLDWQGHYFHKQLLNNLEKLSVNYSLLKTFIDLDQESSIRTFLSQTSYSSIKKILSSIFSEKIGCTTDFLAEYNGLLIQNTDRGPPLVIQAS